jgi:hypothetical protein
MKKKLKAFKPLTEKEEREAWAKLPSRKHRKVEATTDFDIASVNAKDEGVDEDPVSHGLASEGAPVVAADAEQRWTLPETMAHARQEIANFLPHTASDIGWGALGMGCLLSTTNQRVTGEQLEKLEAKTPEERFMELCPPDKRAETIIAFIRVNPRSLLNPNNNGKWLVTALVNLLEAAHFGTGANQLPGLLPEGNRKLTASTARRALRLLSRGEQGNPPDYPLGLLASEVGLIQVALAPIKKTWADSGNLQTVRQRHGDEVTILKDKELRSLLTDKLLVAAARLAEKATGISAESFVRAWEKEPTLHEIFRNCLHQ